MGGPNLSVSAAILGLGLAMTGLGTILILLSFRKRGGRENVEKGAAGVIFIGPIPIVFGGRGKWVMVGITTAILTALLIAVAIVQPDLIGW